MDRAERKKMLIGVGGFLAVGGFVALAQNAPQMIIPDPSPTTATPVVEAASTVVPPEANGNDRRAEELDKSIRKTLAVSIILSGHGCQKVVDWDGAGAGGENVVTCVERKGRSKTVRYRVVPLKGLVVPL